MNAPEETLPLSPMNQPSNDSLLTPSLPYPKSLPPDPPEFMEAPLASLCVEPIHQLSDEELLARIQEIRARRQSHQTFKAAEARKAEEEDAREPKAPKTKKKSAVASLFDSLADSMAEESAPDSLADLFNNLPE